MMLYRPICNIIRKTVFSNRKIHYGLQDTVIVNYKHYNLCTKYLYSQNLNLISNKRFITYKGSALYNEHNEDKEDLEYFNPKAKVITFNTTSLRLDAIAKAGLGMSRANFEKEFYKSNIRLNGRIHLKKHVLVNVEDEIDHILTQSPENPKCIIVNRCKVVSISVGLEKIQIKVIQDKNLMIENYDKPWTCN